MNETKKRNVIIGSLCAVLLLMVVGYAAFSTALKINGTANISSTWNILITDIQTKNIVGGASNAEAPTGVNTLTATFKTNLVSPGDSIEYDITVTNSGSLNATLEKITKTDSNNPAIKFTTTGLTEGSTLAAGQSQTLTVKVEYDSTVTGQPESTTSDLKITLDYVQEGKGGTVTPDPTPQTQTVYRWTKDRLSIGDSIEGIETIEELEEHYDTLNKYGFLKHIVTDGKTESSEVCFRRNGQMYCLIGGDNGAAFETNKATLLEAFGESVCFDLPDQFYCETDSTLTGAIAYHDGTVTAGCGTGICEIDGTGISTCFWDSTSQKPLEKDVCHS